MDLKKKNKSMKRKISNSVKTRDQEKLLEEENESKDSESNLDKSEQWDNATRIIAQNSVKHIGYHLLATCAREPGNQTNKKPKMTVEIRSDLIDNDFINQFKNKWSKSEELKSNNLQLITNPFKICVAENFISNSDILNAVREEFNEIYWNERNMDLYEFYQSKDLKYLDANYINAVYKFLKTDVRDWVSNLLGFELTHTSATCSLYSNTDFLLVHDDQLGDRMVAFVLYLTSGNGWCKENGGALQLFDRDQDGHPFKPVRDIYPSNNQFLFFPVTNASYHQVGEITTLEDCRLSINGWFHIKNPPLFKHPLYIPKGLFSDEVTRPQEIDILLESWISEEYLEEDAFSVINSQIEDCSEICLREFFKHEPYNEILGALNNQDVKWKKVGPANRRNYEVIAEENMPYTVERFLNLFKCNKMFELLKHYTELDLKTMKFELQKWTPGSYMLLTDYPWDAKQELDLIYHIGLDDGPAIGGRVQYVAIEETVQSAFVTIEPHSNCLSLVYRDTARFIKPLSKQSSCQQYYMLICSYAE